MAGITDDDETVEVEAQDDEYGNDEDIRANAGLNSPKNQQQMNFQDDEDDGPGVGGGMTLNLGDVSDDDENYTKVTPNTKRDQMGVNSPREKHQQFPKDDAANNSALSGLVTQVARDDDSNGAEALVTQVPRPDDDQTERDLKDAQTSGGICACFSCLWSCCSGPQPPEPVPMKPTNNATQNNYTQKDDAGDGTKTTKNKSKENANSHLLAGGTNDQKEESLSSSTEYDVSLLPPKKPEHVNQKCLILDLDETLVHSSFKPIPKPDFIIPVEIDRVVHHVYVLKRPYVDEFLLRASKHYEIVIFTASLSKYADPLLDKLDIHNVIDHRLFRESCVIHGTAYVKDLRKLGRKLRETIIVDNSPPSYLFQPSNAVPITSWFDDPTDTQLLDFCPVIESTMKNVDDVRKLLDANNKSFRWLCNQADQPLSNYTQRTDQQ